MINQPNPTAPTAPPQMQMGDIVVALEAVYLASARGAFRPDEFTVIGSSYERLYAFCVASGIIKPVVNNANTTPSTTNMGAQGNKNA